MRAQQKKFFNIKKGGHKMVRFYIDLSKLAPSTLQELYIALNREKSRGIASDSEYAEVIKSMGMIRDIYDSITGEDVDISQ